MTNLQWPFEGDIVVDLLTLEGRQSSYRGDTISLKDVHYSCVTESG